MGQLQGQHMGKQWARQGQCMEARAEGMGQGQKMERGMEIRARAAEKSNLQQRQGHLQLGIIILKLHKIIVPLF